MAVQEKLITADELLEQSAFEKGYELVKGTVVKMAPSGTEHFFLSAWIAHLLITHVVPNALGRVGGSEGGFLLATNPDAVRAPDVSFVAKARLTTPLPKGYFPGAPDLAVEIVSPSDRASDIHSKVLDYLDAGTRLVWVVYPDTKTTTVHQAGAGAVTLGIGDELDGGDVLPGFKLPAHEVFHGQP